MWLVFNEVQGTLFMNFEKYFTFSFAFLIHFVSESNMIVKDISETLKDLRVFNSPQSEKKRLECFLNAFLSVRVSVRAPQRFEELYPYSVFKSSSITGPCSVSMNILAPKWGVSNEPHKAKWRFRRKWLEWFLVHFSKLSRPACSVNLYGWHLQGNNSTRTKGPKAKCRFHTDGFNGWTDFRFHSVQNNRQRSFEQQSTWFPSKSSHGQFYMRNYVECLCSYL
jgi:hypothetical protein